MQECIFRIHFNGSQKLRSTLVPLYFQQITLGSPKPKCSACGCVCYLYHHKIKLAMRQRGRQAFHTGKLHLERLREWTRFLSPEPPGFGSVFIASTCSYHRWAIGTHGVAEAGECKVLN